jgi:Zn finger protein HypA/HybF involved in hydrogenase expression
LGRHYQFAVLSVEEVRVALKCDRCGQTVLSEEALYRVPPPPGKPSQKTPRVCLECAQKAGIVPKRKDAA